MPNIDRPTKTNEKHELLTQYETLSGQVFPKQ